MIRIVVDSGSDTPIGAGLCHHHIPLTVTIGGADYQDGHNLTAGRFYELLTSTQEFPKTSQPSPEAFLEAFLQAMEAQDDVLCFCLSSALSGTYQSALIAKDMAEYDRIFVIDTGLVSHPLGVLVRYANKRIREGASAEQILQECESVKGRIRVFAGLDTLEYLYKGGRLSRASATVGQIAGIKPIITFTQAGTVSLCGKAIGVPRAIQTILSKIDDQEIDPVFPVDTLYTCGTENVEKLEGKLQAMGVQTNSRLQIGPAIGTHVGPDVYGVVFVVKE